MNRIESDLVAQCLVHMPLHDDAVPTVVCYDVCSRVCISPDDVIRTGYYPNAIYVIAQWYRATDICADIVSGNNYARILHLYTTCVTAYQVSFGVVRHTISVCTNTRVNGIIVYRYAGTITNSDRAGRVSPYVVAGHNCTD